MSDSQLINILIIYIAKTFFITLTSVVLLKGNIFRKKYKKTLYSNIIAITTLVPLILLPFRFYIHNYVINMLVLTLSISFFACQVFEIGIKLSFLITTISVHILTSVEVLLTPLYDQIMSISSIVPECICYTLFILLNLSIKIFIIFILAKYNLNNNPLVNTKWHALTKSKRTTLIILLFLVLFNLMFNLFYVDFYIVSKMNDVNLEIIQMNLIIFFIQSVIITLVTLLIISRTIIYENYRDIFINNKNTFKTILYRSSKENIKLYNEVLKARTNIVTITDIERYLNQKVDTYELTYYITNEVKLLSYNFINIHIFIREILHLIKDCDTSVIINLSTFDDSLCLILDIRLNDIDKLRVLKKYKNDSYIKSLIRLLEENSGNFSINGDKAVRIGVTIPLALNFN